MTTHDYKELDKRLARIERVLFVKNSTTQKKQPVVEIDIKKLLKVKSRKL